MTAPRPLAINCYSYIWRLGAADTLRHLADRGYSTFELMVNWPHLWPSAMGTAARREVARLMAQRGLSLVSLAPPMLDLNLVSPAPEMRRYTIEHYIDVIRLAGEWNCAYVVLVPGKIHPLLPLPDDFRDAWFARALDELDRAAEAEGVRLTLENVPSSWLPRAGDVMRRLALIGNDRIGVTYDVANGVFAGEDPGEGLAEVAPKLSFVHVSDTGLQSWAHSTIGSGVVPFDRVAAALEAIGFTGPTTLEVISQDPDADIAASHAALARLGWEAPPRRTEG
jgi:sugar phosphate isomerase/epimerase